MTDPWTPYKVRELEALLTERDRRILLDLEQFRALSTRLIQRRQFAAGASGPHATVATATRLVSRVLGRLEQHGFIARIERRIGGPLRGSAAITWHLAATGERLLRARREDPVRRRFTTPSRQFLEHTLAIAELSTSLQERATLGGFEVLDLQTEPRCWRPFNTSGGLVTLKPDLSVVIADSDFEAHVFIEIDRATENLPSVIKKCQLYQRYRQTGIEQNAIGLFPAVVWVTPDSQRASKLHAAIRREPTLDTDQFIVCETATAMDVLASSLIPKGGTS